MQQKYFLPKIFLSENITFLSVKKFCSKIPPFQIKSLNAIIMLLSVVKVYSCIGGTGLGGGSCCMQPPGQCGGIPSCPSAQLPYRQSNFHNFYKKILGTLSTLAMSKVYVDHLVRYLRHSGTKIQKSDLRHLQQRL